MPFENEKWGYLRETKEEAVGFDLDTGLKRTALEDYLEVIFPDVHDWIHDKPFGEITPEGNKIRNRPDFRSGQLKLIIEFDGLPHYNYPETIKRDIENTKIYQSFGYKVVRIPFFIQLTNAAVYQLFGVKVEQPLFNANIPSLGPKGKNTPAYLCGAGVLRMAKEFHSFPEQYKVNIEALKAYNDECLTGAGLLEKLYSGE